MKAGFAFLLIIVALGATVAAAPKIDVEDSMYDFGEVLEGIAVTHTFTLRNVGDEPLVIKRVRADCGCTTADLPKDNLSPGESTELEISIDTAGFGGDIAKRIYIESNDPTTPTLTLRVTGTVRQPERYHTAVSDLDYLFYLLIDLRDPEAYATAHLMGAINIPYAELGDWTSRLPQDVLIILYDQDGSVSDEAAQMLNSAGFPEAKSLLGGLGEWTRQFQEKLILSSSG